MDQIKLYTKNQEYVFDFVDAEIYYAGEFERHFFYNEELGTLILATDHDQALCGFGTKGLNIQAFEIDKMDLSEFSRPTSITCSAFSKFKNLQIIKVPKRTHKIGYQAFANMSKLKRVILPKNVNYISLESFLNCENLECVNVSENARIGANAFAGCPKIEDKLNAK